MASLNLHFLSNPSQLIVKLLQKGLSQTQIAEVAKTTPPTISRILSGRIKNPRAIIFVRLCSMLESFDGVRGGVKEERSAEGASSP